MTFIDRKREGGNDRGYRSDTEGHRDAAGSGDEDDVPAFVIVDNHHVWLRGDEGHEARIYTITVTAMDGAGNTSSGSVIVDPPHEWE